RMARPVDPQRGVVEGRGNVGLAHAGDPRLRQLRSRRGNANGGGGHGKGLIFLLALGFVVLFAGFMVIGPAAAGFAYGLAESNPQTLRWPFVADIVRSRIADDLDTAAGTDPAEVRFRVESGATAGEVADALVDQGLIKNRLALEYLLITEDAAKHLEAGTHTLRQTMTPQEILARLQDAPERTVAIALREGLRLEQIAAYLTTLEGNGLEMNVREFYTLASKPSDELRSEYEFLSHLPKGRSLEGFLGPGTFEVYTDITPEELVRLLLEQWETDIGSKALPLIQAADKDVYETLALASIVEKEATLNEERPRIAGVYQNRVDAGMLLNADPTVFYAWDTVQLRERQFAAWRDYAFWTPIGRPLAEVEVPQQLRGFQTYVRTGMIPAPICTPTLGSIRAAIEPDTDDGYLYFVAIHDGSNRHAFAKTLEEHNANRAKYGYT
ncbi:MAG: endolytic transglycosylase MltG, partial [Chloroflexi bacterium]|nr:endolytic transglycosylase MltG [Chloroflexota bacterium]